MLEHLGEFCNFYVYSHGLKHYIQEILKNLDPEERWFKDRGVRVLAPVNEVE